MEASRRLYELIASLNKQEKRYFKLYASFYAKQSSRRCTQLFDCINKAGICSDEELLQSHARSFPPRKLPRLKNELTALLLDSLVAFRARHLTDTEILFALLQVEVLLEKGLHQHARVVLERAKKKAREVENFPLLLQALFWERSLLLSRYDRDLEQQLETLYAEIIQALDQQRSYYDYTRLQDFTMLLWGSYKQRADSSAAEKLHSYFSHAFIQDAKHATTVRARVARLHIMGIAALSRNEIREAGRLYAEIIALLEKRPALIKRNSNQYIRYLLQQLACLVELKSDEDAAALAARIREFEQLPPHLKSISHLGALGLELTLFINLGRVEKAAGVVEQIEAFLDDAGQSIHPQTFINACHNCTVFYFLTGNNPKALEYTNHLLHENRIVLRKDLQECARAFNLVLHYELGNLDILEHLFRSTYRYLKQHDRLESIEKTVLNHLRKLLNCIDQAERQSTLRQFYVELLDLHREQTVVMGVEELLYWLESKLEDCPIREVYLRNVHSGS